MMTLAKLRKIKPKMRAVKSSLLKSVGYNDGVLFTRFKGNALYAYVGVPEKLYIALRSLDELKRSGDDVSVGKVFVMAVRHHPEKYPFRRIA